ncbi:MAG TPA: hypothetical protein VF452_20750 [Candidatus Binatia bacterium]
MKKPGLRVYATFDNDAGGIFHDWPETWKQAAMLGQAFWAGECSGAFFYASFLDN